MRLSHSFAKPLRQPPAGADSANAKYLLQGGYIDQLAAGIYSFLPLGWRVYQKVVQVIREEMNALGGQELNLPALHPAEPWRASGRWDDTDVQEVMYQFEDHSGKPYGLGFTHEEIIADIGKRYIESYRDLPLAVYQIQTKFRNEPRAKSGLLRGREFQMKDLYSFHVNEEDLDRFYEEAKQAYATVYERLDLDAVIVEASAGVFASESNKYSHEFQVFCEAGEDTIYHTEDRSFAQNEEIYDAQNAPDGVQQSKAIEVGNIFKLGTRFTEAAGVSFQGEDGSRHAPIMASYGIGPSRIVGTIVETHHDDKGIIWPEAVAPYRVHLLHIGDDEAVTTAAATLYDDLQKAGAEVLYDDRDESAGIKFNDADLLGLPLRVTVSPKTLEKDSVETKRRDSDDVELIPLKDAAKQLA